MMRIDLQNDAETPALLLATLEGSLDPEAAARLQLEILPHLGAATPKLLVDMSHVAWMGSAGVGALMHLLARVQANGGALALVGCAPRVLSVIQVCGLESILNVSADAAEARRRLDTGSPS